MAKLKLCFVEKETHFSHEQAESTSDEKSKLSVLTSKSQIFNIEPILTKIHHGFKCHSYHECIVFWVPGTLWLFYGFSTIGHKPCFLFHHGSHLCSYYVFFIYLAFIDSTVEHDGEGYGNHLMLDLNLGPCVSVCVYNAFAH